MYYILSQIKLGEISDEVKSILSLSCQNNRSIFLGESNVVHMKRKHLDAYTKYGKYLSDIICNPDYVGENKSDNSIEYVKEFFEDSEYVKVAVRVSQQNIYFARSIYVLNKNRVHTFINKGTLKFIKKS